MASNTGTAALPGEGGRGRERKGEGEREREREGGGGGGREGRREIHVNPIYCTSRYADPYTCIYNVCAYQRMYIVRPLPVTASHDDVLTEGQHSEEETYTKYNIIDEGSSYNGYTDVHYTLYMYNVHVQTVRTLSYTKTLTFTHPQREMYMNIVLYM